MGYYQLDQEEYDTVVMHINFLISEDIAPILHTNEYDFVEQMHRRLIQYERDIMISLKQRDWLAKMFERYQNKEEAEPTTDKRFKRFDRS